MEIMIAVYKINYYLKINTTSFFEIKGDKKVVKGIKKV